MEDNRIWAIEESLWTGDADHYRALIDDECVMVLPEPPFVLSGRQAIEAVANTPRWTSVEFSEQQIMRPQEGLITIAYKAEAQRDGSTGYEAYCTTTMRRLEHDEWRVVQHQQTPPLAASGSKSKSMTSPVGARYNTNGALEPAKGATGPVKLNL